MLLLMIGGAIATGALTAALRWIARKLRQRPLPAVIHGLSLLIAVSLYAIGNANGNPPRSEDFAFGVFVYGPSQILWFALEFALAADKTARNSE